ncbi:MAG: 23S rRNA (uracil(1939)-C(5))-methyltransferase RlmD [Proteobacteria bacterium]|nr:MAG: 23S rRNA (uracil(1939)-C(5))-methyltransferase RlmD [Pseudomonadota bacterium]
MIEPTVLSHAPRRGERFEIAITRLGESGEGEAELPSLLGPQRAERTFVFAVRKAMVGDRVVAEVERRRGPLISARLAEVVTPSPHRVEARCAHFGRREDPGRGCGGCTLQALDYPAQLAAKRDLVQRAMVGQGVDPRLVAAPIGCARPWRYRNKMEFSFGDDPERDLAVGLYRTGWRNEVLPLSECHLVSEAAASLVPRARAWAETLGVAPFKPRRGQGALRQLTVREGKRTDERLVELVTTSDPVIDTAEGPRAASEVARSFSEMIETTGLATSVYWTQHHAARGERSRLITHHLSGAEVYHEELELPDGRRLRFAIHPRAFFQPNPRQAEVLYATALAKLGPDPKLVLDLYCGTGTLALFAAPFVDQVVGVELVADAIENARANAEANGISNVRWQVGDVGEVLTDPAEAGLLANADAVMVDPPRAGLSPRALAQLVSLRPKRIVYVSCRPTSLARDLARLIEGGYAIEGGVQPVDMFPHTPHVESVVALVRQEGP